MTENISDAERFATLWRAALKHLLRWSDVEIEAFITAHRRMLRSDWLGHDPEFQAVSEFFTTSEYRLRDESVELRPFRVQIELAIDRYAASILDGSVHWPDVREAVNNLLCSKGYTLADCIQEGLGRGE